MVGVQPQLHPPWGGWGDRPAGGLGVPRRPSTLPHQKRPAVNTHPTNRFRAYPVGLPEGRRGERSIGALQCGRPTSGAGARRRVQQSE